MAQRISYLWFMDDVSNNERVCNRCTQPLCVNPFHLTCAPQAIRLRRSRAEAHPESPHSPSSRSSYDSDSCEDERFILDRESMYYEPPNFRECSSIELPDELRRFSLSEEEKRKIFDVLT